MNCYLGFNRFVGSTLFFLLLATYSVTPLDAALVGKYDASLGTTVVDDIVTEWADQIGGYTLTANNSPSLVSSVTPNGSPAIRFDGAESDALGGATTFPTGFPLAGATSLTTAVVFRPDQINENDPANPNFWGHPQLASGDQGGGHPDWGFGWGPDENGIHNIWFGVGNDVGDATPTVKAAGAVNNGNWYIGIGTWNGAGGINAYLYDQSGSLISSNFVETPEATVARVDVGFSTGAERPNLNTRNFDGEIAAIELYDHGVDATGANAIAAALNSAYLGGTPILPILLEVNTTTGLVTMKNPNPSNSIHFDYYEIRSEAGALNSAAWNSLDAQNFDAVDGPDPGNIAGDSPGEGWDEAGGSNNQQLIEYYLDAANSELPSDFSISLGNAFTPAVLGAGNDGDLVFQYGTADGSMIAGMISYVDGGEGLPGDYNRNGIVDAADYTVWRDNLNSGSLANEGAGVSPGTVDEQDYEFWKSNFGATSAGASASGVTAVPEPMTLVLVILGLTIAPVRRSRQGGASF